MFAQQAEPRCQQSVAGGAPGPEARLGEAPPMPGCAMKALCRTTAPSRRHPSAACAAQASRYPGLAQRRQRQHDVPMRLPVLGGPLNVSTGQKTPHMQFRHTSGFAGWQPGRASTRTLRGREGGAGLECGRRGHRPAQQAPDEALAGRHAAQVAQKGHARHQQLPHDQQHPRVVPRGQHEQAEHRARLRAPARAESGQGRAARPPALQSHAQVPGRGRRASAGPMLQQMLAGRTHMPSCRLNATRARVRQWRARAVGRGRGGQRRAWAPLRCVW